MIVASIGRYHFFEQARALAAEGALSGVICDDPRVRGLRGGVAPARVEWLAALGAARLAAGRLRLPAGHRLVRACGAGLARALRRWPEGGVVKINSGFARETLAEYCAYEFGTQSAAEALELVDLLERAASNQYQKLPVEAEVARRAWRLAENIHRRLPGWAQRNWRWEIVRLRALLDRERFAGGGLGTDEAEAAMLRLAELYHCQLETDDPYHHRVRPPLRGAVSRRGEW